MPEPIVIFENVHKSYRGTKAVDGIRFELRRTLCFGLLGRNGAGKSTIMRLIYGKAARDREPSGRVRVFGFDPEKDELEIKSRSGVVPQEDNLDEELDVTQNLQVFAKLYGMTPRAANDRIRQLLEFMELGDRARAAVRELSGGMKRRLVIARALLNEPKLLILDEPTTGLDPQVRHIIWDKLRQLRREGLSILLSTHYMEEAFQLCDEVLIVEKGRAVLRGSPKTLVERDIEGFVLELHNPDLVRLAIQQMPPDSFRVDESDETIRVYGNDQAALKAFADRVAPSDHHLRPSTLEDVFLRATGRRLDAHQ